MTVAAYDSYFPATKATAQLTITVLRNPAAPVFSLAQYAQSVNEYYDTGKSVLAVAATDADGVMHLFSNLS